MNSGLILSLDIVHLEYLEISKLKVSTIWNCFRPQYISVTGMVVEIKGFEHIWMCYPCKRPSIYVVAILLTVLVQDN